MFSVNRMKELLDYNPDTGVFTWKVNRANIIKAGDTAGGVITFPHNNKSYAHIRMDGVLYKAHRLAWLYVYGDLSDDDQIDHINNDSTDNRICNLRIVTGQENVMNKRKYKNNKSGHTGVYKLGNRWRAIIGYEGKRLHIGMYDTIEDAVVARKEKQKELGFTELHGE